jgi:hypothetical protein
MFDNGLLSTKVDFYRSEWLLVISMHPTCISVTSGSPGWQLFVRPVCRFILHCDFVRVFVGCHSH